MQHASGAVPDCQAVYSPTVEAPAVLLALNTQPTYPLITRVYPKAHDRKLRSMHLSRHKKQPAIESLYLGIPRDQAVACEECDSVTRAVNARCASAEAKRSPGFHRSCQGTPGRRNPRRPWAFPSMRETSQKIARAYFLLSFNFSLGC